MANFCACGGELARVHRTFSQRFIYEAVYRCLECRALKPHPRRFMFYFEHECVCPLCRTRKLTRLNSPDHIDPMRWNLFGVLRHFVAMQLYHCRYCRIQFYGRPRTAKGDPVAAGR